jgi:hypothetical protein
VDEGNGPFQSDVPGRGHRLLPAGFGPVQHLSIFDVVAVSGTLENRGAEFVDHLHERCTDPCIVTNGSYELPWQPGYSAQMFEQSEADYGFPGGRYWAGAAAAAAPVSADAELEPSDVAGMSASAGV